MSNIITSSVKQTQKMGEILAKKVLKIGPNNEGAFLVCLEGDLGAGKTTFTQGMAKGFGVKEVINSPTFVIMKRFAITGSRFKNLFHIDCYRLEKQEDILELDWNEILNNPQNIIIIEWPEKIKQFLPKEHLSILFKFISEKTRQINID